MLNAVLVSFWAGIFRQVKGWVMCPPWTAESFQPSNAHSALTAKYFGCVSVPSFCHGYLSFYFGFLVPLSSSSALVPHLPSLTCWLIQLFWWHSRVGQTVPILVPALAFKPCPNSNLRAEVLKMNCQGWTCQCKEGDWGIWIRGFDFGVTVGQCTAQVPKWKESLSQLKFCKRGRKCNVAWCMQQHAYFVELICDLFFFLDKG